MTKINSILGISKEHPSDNQNHEKSMAISTFYTNNNFCRDDFLNAKIIVHCNVLQRRLIREFKEILKWGCG